MDASNDEGGPDNADESIKPKVFGWLRKPMGAFVAVMIGALVAYSSTAYTNSNETRLKAYSEFYASFTSAKSAAAFVTADSKFVDPYRVAETWNSAAADKLHGATLLLTEKWRAIELFGSSGSADKIAHELWIYIAHIDNSSQNVSFYVGRKIPPQTQEALNKPYDQKSPEERVLAESHYSLLENLKIVSTGSRVVGECGLDDESSVCISDAAGNLEKRPNRELAKVESAYASEAREQVRSRDWIGRLLN
ncbi:hypothetical protein FK529_13940 [Tsukamurella asaccharolytica]|uniref:Uncharacterized protein n=1 Tax=Tsukamurella asaccharolytica TaxID=2592067 RepID=A0A5C5R7U1_9ACTN|nr:hypothetical protein [Tsukamurella asaccharolytica]TWS18682.1 hypothetical protein FK529_13940 [Tsukamurella asaccharolytica]